MQTMTDYIEEYKKYHADKNTNYPGNNLKPQLHHIVDLVKDTKAGTLLDYGCGKGLQYTKWKHHEEIGVTEHDVLPDGPFDGIYSTDVMEHIPKEHLQETFENIFSRAERFVFLAICTQPAIAVLPNGENAHCTVEPIEFWVSMVNKYSPKKVYTHIKTYGNCNNYEILNEDLYNVISY